MSGLAALCEGMKCGTCQSFSSILNHRAVFCCSKHAHGELFFLSMRLFAWQPLSTWLVALPPPPPPWQSLFHSHSVISSNFSVPLPRQTQKKPGPLAAADPAVIAGSVSALHTSPFICLMFPFSFSPSCPESFINFSCFSLSAFCPGATFKQGLDDDVTSVRSYRVCMWPMCVCEQALYCWGSGP